MPANIASNFAAACRVTNMDCVLEVEGFNERRQVVCVSIHFVSIPWLARTAMAPPVMSDAPESVVAQKHHLVFPSIRTQGPTVAEDYRLSFTPVLVVDLSGVFGRDCRLENWFFLIGHKNSLLCPHRN